MAYSITSECINCGACEPECPNEAIREGSDSYVVDSARCTECVGFNDTVACAAVCPTDACAADPAHKETEAQLIARAVALHPEKADLKAQAASGQFPSHLRH
ncbi:MAG: YfhL family 4Fe-4S dicluster ferredoxin [Polyangiaceae bacterium]|jgi:ferredoxin